MNPPTPTTQAVEQLREKIEDIPIGGRRLGTYISGEATNQIISALADTLKIVGGDVISLDEMNATPIEPYTEDAMFRDIRDTLRQEQRQRLDLVVGEMKGR